MNYLQALALANKTLFRRVADPFVEHEVVGHDERTKPGWKINRTVVGIGSGKVGRGAERMGECDGEQERERGGSGEATHTVEFWLGRVAGQGAVC